MDVEFITLTGSEIAKYLDDLAQLRIKVFNEYPYLYEGDMDYEKKYLSTYTQAQSSFVALALIAGQIVGATTCIGLWEESEEFQKPFKTKYNSLDNIFYFGESIILKDYRGNKIGHKFFELRESHAKNYCATLSKSCFCSVVREENHPLKPSNYKGLDSFWQRMGYEKNEDMIVYYSWKDLNKEVEDKKPLVFWIKQWN